MADSDLTTPAAVAGVLGVNSSDSRLPRLIGAASEAIRRFIDRPQLHYSAGIVEKLQGYSGQVRLYLGAVPLISVASIVLPDGTTLDPSEYTVEDLPTSALYRADGWPFTGLCEGGVLYGEARTIVVTYAGGWVTPAQSGVRTLPYDIEEACLMTVTALFRRQGVDPLITSESLGDYSVTFAPQDASAGGLPEVAKAMLGTYRRLSA